MMAEDGTRWSCWSRRARNAGRALRAFSALSTNNGTALRASVRRTNRRRRARVFADGLNRACDVVQVRGGRHSFGQQDDSASGTDRSTMVAAQLASASIAGI
jgi:hypothetical protein